MVKGDLWELLPFGGNWIDPCTTGHAAATHPMTNDANICINVSTVNCPTISQVRLVKWFTHVDYILAPYKYCVYYYYYY